MMSSIIVAAFQIIQSILTVVDGIYRVVIVFKNSS